MSRTKIFQAIFSAPLFYDRVVNFPPFYTGNLLRVRIRYTLYSYVYNYENVQMVTSLSKFDWKETAIDRGGKLDEARDFSLTKLREIRATITSAPNLSSQTILLEVQSFPCDLSIPPRLPRRSSCFPLSRHHPRI